MARAPTLPRPPRPTSHRSAARLLPYFCHRTNKTQSMISSILSCLNKHASINHFVSTTYHVSGTKDTDRNVTNAENLQKLWVRPGRVGAPGPLVLATVPLSAEGRAITITKHDTNMRFRNFDLSFLCGSIMHLIKDLYIYFFGYYSSCTCASFS